VNQHSVFCVVARLWTERSGLRLPTGARDFSFLKNVRSSSGTDPGSYSVGTGFLSPGAKRRGARSWPLSSSVVVKNEWRYTSTPRTCLHGTRTTFLCPLTIWRLKLIFFTHETLVRTSQWPQFVAIRKPGHVFLPVECDNHIKRTNSLCWQNAVFRVTVGGVNCNHSYLRVNYLCDNSVYVSQITITFPYPTPATDICTVDKRLGLILFPIHGALPDV
jgi:hypothetical protein